MNEIGNMETMSDDQFCKVEAEQLTVADVYDEYFWFEFVRY